MTVWDVGNGHLFGVWNNSGETPISLFTGSDGHWIALLYQNDLAEFRKLPGKTLRTAIAEVGLDLARGSALPREMCVQLHIYHLSGANLVCAER